MYMKHHQKSITLMGCIDELNRTHTHQRNLNHIYMQVCPCQAGKTGGGTSQVRGNSSRERWESEPASSSPVKKYPHTLSHIPNPKHSHPHPHPHPHPHQHSSTHICLTQMHQNRKLSQLHRTSHKNQVKSKSKCVIEENRKFIDKLVNVKSQLEEFYSNNQNGGYGGYGGYGYGGVGYQGSRSSREGRWGDGGFVCSSAVNRNKLIKKINQQNRNIHRRLQTAMSKSQYSQHTLKKPHKTQTPSNININIQIHKQSQKQQQLMRRTMAQLQGEKKTRPRFNTTGVLGRYCSQDKEKGRGRGQGWERDQLQFDGDLGLLVENDRRNTETQKSEIGDGEYRYMTSQQKYSSKYKFRTKKYYENPVQQNQRTKTEGNKTPYSLTSKNQITKLYQNSINQLQTNTSHEGKMEKFGVGEKEKEKEVGMGMGMGTSGGMGGVGAGRMVSRLRTEGNVLLSGKWNNSFGQAQHESQSIKKMRRAAMLHFRKIQKMKATQSKIWQIPQKSSQHQHQKPTYSPSHKSSQKSSNQNLNLITQTVQIQIHQKEQSPNKSILLTGIY